ncbi:4258_t:CDS:2, partial [Funneliformis mosseae]
TERMLDSLILYLLWEKYKGRVVHFWAFEGTSIKSGSPITSPSFEIRLLAVVKLLQYGAGSGPWKTDRDPGAAYIVFGSFLGSSLSALVQQAIRLPVLLVYNCPVFLLDEPEAMAILPEFRSFHRKFAFWMRNLLSRPHIFIAASEVVLEMFARITVQFYMYTPEGSCFRDICKHYNDRNNRYRKKRRVWGS